MYNLAMASNALGFHDEELKLFLASFRIALRYGVFDQVASAQFGLARSYSTLGRTSLAIFFGKQLINNLQQARANLLVADSDLQLSFLQKQKNRYETLAGWLIADGRIAEAQQVLAMLKEEEFFDFVRRTAGEDARKTRASYVGDEARFAQQFNTLRDRLARISAELDNLQRQAKLGLSPTEQAQLNQLQAARDAELRVFDVFLKELLAVMSRPAQETRASTEGAAEHVAAIRSTLATLGHGAVTLHYLVLEDRVNIILTSLKNQVVRESRTSRADLNRKILAYRQVLQDLRRDPLPLARELYDLLLRPVQADLEKDAAGTLMLSLDGTLRYLPFAALHDGKSYATERYRIALYTEAARERLTNATVPAWQFTGLGVTREVPGFSPLPAVKQELEGILKQSGVPGDIYLDEAFTEEQLRTSLLSKRAVLHIASHFVFQPGTDVDSFLLMGDGSKLTLAEMKKHSFEGIDLMTLSACETALGGGRDANGREIEGFGALAQRQGARSVFSQLCGQWPIRAQGASC